ncbi:nitroreductase family protein, partial [Candidatus Woesearchaeota archaeon]|nr:nitroreductase family protein [Candidatus Woesearchaeota archaeon]
MAKQTTYADAGVNLELGDDVSKILYNAARQTWDNRKGKLGELIVPFDDFSGVRAVDVSGLPKGTLMNIGFDGVGTKMELAERINDHRTIAYDLFAMVCDDAVVRGAEPVLIGSILDVNSLGKENETYIEQVRQLAQGYIEAAKAANVAIVNGEVAELGSRVGGFGNFNYNWGAAVVWFANRARLFTGREIRDDDRIIGLREYGFRSNGLSLVRRIMKEYYGEKATKYAAHNVELAISYIMLKATSVGLATCYIAAFDENAVKRILKVPDAIQVEALITLGYAAEEPEEKRRLPLSAITFFDEYGK